MKDMAERWGCRCAGYGGYVVSKGRCVVVCTTDVARVLLTRHAVPDDNIVLSRSLSQARK